jgi:hypothetical protein
MKEQHHAVEESFYRECARLLGAAHTFRPWVGPPPDRWNNRHPGNGRFPGFGTIRMYGPNHIHISLRHPVVLSKTCRSPDEVFRVLRRLQTIRRATNV